MGCISAAIIGVGHNYTIVNNLFYEIDSGVPIGAWGGDNWKIVNNTFYTKNDSEGLSSQIFATYSPFGPNNWLIANNLIYNLGDGVWPCIQDREEARYGWTITNNLCYGAPLTDFTAGATFSKNITGEDPLFLNAQQYDFRLGQDSPAIDAGIHIPGINDNFLGSAPDIGACEFGSSMCPSGGGASTPPGTGS